MAKADVASGNSCREQDKLLNERSWLIAGIRRPVFAHHMHCLDAAEDHTGSGYGLEAEHGLNPLLKTLLNPMFQVGVHK